MNPIFLIDFYKVGHREQYPPDTQQVWSNWVPRSSRVEGAQSMVFFGNQYFLKEILIKRFNEEFFAHPLQAVLHSYQDVMKATLGVENPETSHIEWLHRLGYLPVKIYALPEGTNVPLGMPALVITNTLDEGFWLPNYLETILSNSLWMASTSASTAQRYRELFVRYARSARETDLGFIDWQGHDFSFRGMSGVDSAILSGMGHLTSFSGTDTLPAILAARQYYGAPLTVGGSVPATEHSVMCAGERSGEFETFRHLIEDVYPSGIVSIVSDTWDLWKVLTDYIPRLCETILKRSGKVVIRPDSGDPIKIMIGDPQAEGPAKYGVLRLLADALGVTAGSGRLPMIRGAGTIYGDSITLDRADAILDGCVNKLGLSPFNCVFGIGSYTYQHVTRDTYNLAMKATAVRRSGKVIPIFKAPVTDNSNKKSLIGIPAVYRSSISTSERPEYILVQDCKPEALDQCEFLKVFEDGQLLVEESFEAIRKRVRA